MDFHCFSRPKIACVIWCGIALMFGYTLLNLWCINVFVVSNTSLLPAKPMLLWPQSQHESQTVSTVRLTSAELSVPPPVSDTDDRHFEDAIEKMIEKLRPHQQRGRKNRYDDSELGPDKGYTGPHIERPLSLAWHAKQHLMGLAVDSTEKTAKQPRYSTFPNTVNPIYDYFVFVHGKNNTMPKATYETLTQHLLSRRTGTPEQNLYGRPRVVHYVFVALSKSALALCADDGPGMRLNFVQYLGIRSAFINLFAERVVIHANCSFHGTFMDQLRRLVGDVIRVHNAHDEAAEGRRLRIERLPDVTFRTAGGVELLPYHKADYMKAWVAYTHGGIVADFDLLFQPGSAEVFYTAGQYSQCTIGSDVASERLNRRFFVNMGLLHCNPGSAYMRDWLESYQTDYKTNWTYNSGNLPTMLFERHPETPLLVDSSMSLVDEHMLVRPRPNAQILKFWHMSSVIHHLSHQRHDFIVPLLREQLFNRHSSVLARTMRQILYGSEDVCEERSKYAIPENMLPRFFHCVFNYAHFILISRWPMHCVRACVAKSWQHIFRDSVSCAIRC